MAKIHIENGIISSSDDYSLFHGTSPLATIEPGGLRVQGDIIAENYIVSSSVTHMTQSFSSGSTIFGDSNDDTHQFTGSIDVSGSITSRGPTGYYAIDIQGDNTGGPQIHFGNNDATPNEFMVIGAFGSINNILTQARDFRIYDSGGFTGFYFDVSENTVGIGTTSPTKTLEVDGSYNLGSNAFINYDATYPYTINIENTAGVGNLTFQAGTGATGFKSKIELQGGNTATDASITLTTADDPRMTILNSGNIGIGTESPTVALDVSGSTNLSSRIRLAKHVSGTSKILQLGADRDTTAVPFIGSESNNAFDIITNNTQRVRFDFDGKVAIGHTSPDVMLHLKDASSPSVRVEDTTNSVKTHLLAQNSNGHVGTVSNHPFHITSNNTDAITIDTSQNLTLGGNISGSATTTGSFGRVDADTFQNPSGLFLGSTNAAHEFSEITSTNHLFIGAGASSVQMQNDLIPDGNGSQDLGSTNRNFNQIFARTKVTGSSISTGSFGSVFVKNQSNIQFGSINTRIRGDNSNNVLTFMTNNTERVRINDDGMGVGGDPISGVELSVYDALRLQGTAPKFTLQETDATDNFEILEIENSGGHTNFNTRNSANSFVSTDYQLTRNSNGASKHRWFIAGTQRLYVDSTQISGSSVSTGSFGSLVISDAIQGGGNVKGGDFQISANDLVVDGLANATERGLVIKHSGMTSNTVSLVQDANNSRGELNTKNRSLFIQAGTDGFGSGERFRILVNQIASLDILNDGTVLFPVANQKISGSSSSTGSFGRVDGAKKLAIGNTTIPSGVTAHIQSADDTKLRVATANSTFYAELKASVSNDTPLQIIGRGGDVMMRQRTSATEIEFLTDNQVRMHLNSTGLGIGTTDPTEELLISKDDGQPTLMLNRAEGDFSPGIVDNDILGEIHFAGHEGDNTPISVAKILGVANESFSSTSGRGELQFQAGSEAGVSTIATMNSTFGISGSATTTGSFGAAQVDTSFRVGHTDKYGKIKFVRNGGANVGGIGWHSDAVFYVAGHPSHGPTAGNDVRVYGFGSDIHIGDSLNGDVITVQRSSGNVGIGTDTPDVKFHVFDSSALSVEFESSTGNVDLTINSGTDGAVEKSSILLQANSSNKWEILKTTSDNFQIYDYGRSAGVLDIISNGNMGLMADGGNVGIGTTNPSQPLTVAGNISGSGNFEIASTASTPHIQLQKVSGKAWRFYTDGTNSYIRNGTDGYNLVQFFSTGDIGFYNQFGASLGVLWDASTSRLGIGTTSPAYKLHISSSDEKTIQFDRAGQETYRLTHGTSGLFFTKPNSVGIAYGVTQDGDFNAFDSSGNVMFQCDASSGRVGIGLTNGESVLDISGSSQYGQLQIRDGSANIYHRYYVSMSGAFGNGTVHHVPRGVPGSGTSAFTTHFKSVVGGGTTRHDVVIDGNVGIGDTSPDAILDVDNSASTTTTVMHLTDSGGTGTHTMLQLNNTGGSVAQFNIVGNDLLINATSDLILQNSGANIGIGTTSPAVLLHLSSSSANQFRIERSGTTNAAVHFKNASDDWYAGITSQQDFSISQNADIASGTEFRIQDSTGNVGIGTATPEVKLQVMGDTTISGSDSTALDLFVRNHHGTGLSRIIAQNNNVDMNAQLVADDANNVASVGSSTGGSKFIKFVGGTTNAYFDGGNFGIGATSPAERLEISGSEPSIRISDTAAAKHFNIKVASGGGVSKLRFNSETHDNTLLVTNNNRVGIGAGTPAVQLHIEDSQNDTDFTNNSVVGGSSIIISNQQQTDNTFSSLQFIAKESGGNDQSAAIVVESTSATDYSPKLHIVQRRAANTQISRLTIDETGKLGIGNTNPTKTLTVAGEISGSGTGHFANITLARTETIAVNNGNLYYTGGNLGIGTTDPDNKLDVVTSTGDVIAAVRSTSNTSGHDAIFLANVGGTSAGDPMMRFNIDNVGAWTIGVDNTDSDKFKISGLSAVLGTNDRLVIDTSGNVGIGTSVPVSTLTIGGATGILSFNGTHGGGGEGIQYEDSGGTLRYAVNFPGSDVVAISNRAANGVVQIRANTTTAGSSGEKTIAEFRDNQVIFDQGSSTGNLFEFQNSNVNHPMTDEESADVYGTIRPASGTAGGLRLKGLRDSGGSNHSALRLSGFLGESANTSKSTSAHGVVRVDASQTDGTTEVTSLVAQGNLFSISNDGSTKFIVDEDGDVHIDGGYSAYDSYDDAMLIRAISTTTTPKAIIQNQFDKYVKYNERTLVDAGLLGEVTEDEKEKGVKPLINSTGLQKLHNGAIWQQYSEMQQMKELMYETMVEMIGKEAADKKLKKHGLKLLRELDG